MKAKLNDNPWTAVVHLAIPDSKVNKTWVNRAPNLRAMAYFCKDPAKAKTWLNKLDLSDIDFRKEEDRHGRSVATLVGNSKSTGINALLILDKAMQVHPNAALPEDEETSIARALRSEVTVSPADIEAIPENRKVVMAWCRVVNGELVIGGLVDDYKGARKAAAEAGRKVSDGHRNKVAAILAGEEVEGIEVVKTTTVDALKEAV